MLRRRQFGFAAAGCVAALAAPAVRAQATTMRLALIAQVGQPIELGAQRFKQLVEQQTGGKLRVDIFPGGQLGGEIQLQDSVSNGTFQMACIGTPLAAGKLKKLDILNMYYLWKDREHMKRVLTGPIGKDLFDEYGAKTGIEVLAANWQQGTRHTMSKRRFTKPEEARGIKIRVASGVPIYDQLWSAMGASPVPLPFPEAYSGMQTGVVDAVELPLDFIFSNGFYRLGKHLVLTGHHVYANFFLMNAKQMEAQPPEVRRILRESALAAGEHQTEILLRNENELVDKIRGTGVEVVSVDTKVFANAVKPIFERNKDTWTQAVVDKVVGAGG